MRFLSLLVLFCFLTAAATPQGWAFAKKPPQTEAKAGKKYACPMFCKVLDKPGKCPKCGMEMWEVSQ